MLWAYPPSLSILSVTLGHTIITVQSCLCRDRVRPRTFPPFIRLRSSSSRSWFPKAVRPSRRHTLSSHRLLSLPSRGSYDPSWFEYLYRELHYRITIEVAKALDPPLGSTPPPTTTTIPLYTPPLDIVVIPLELFLLYKL